MLEVLIIEV